MAKANPDVQLNMARRRITDDIFLTLVNTYAKEGHFHLGKLTSEQQLRLVGQHLRGVARILTQEYLEETK